jgi:hypothetical protein
MAGLAIEVVIDTMVALAIEVVVDTMVAVAIGPAVAAEVHVDRKVVAVAIGPAVVAVVAAEAFVGRLVGNCPYFLSPSQYSQ